MAIVETSFFTKRLRELISDEEYRRFQLQLVEQPELGRLIPGSGGLRKARIAAKGHGKRGGARIIYYWAVGFDKLLMLYVFPKNVRSDLTTGQLKVLHDLVQEEFG